jgi:hypothetical protein
VDSNAKRLVIHFFTVAGVLFNHFLAGAAASRSKLSHASRKLIVPSGSDQRIKVERPKYIVANLADNRAVIKNEVFDSEAAAHDRMKNLIVNNPDRHGDVHVIPAFEAVLE